LLLHQPIGFSVCFGIFILYGRKRRFNAFFSSENPHRLFLYSQWVSSGMQASQLLPGIVACGETFGVANLICFAFVWTGLVFYTQ
jgi:hypothetical protein